MIIPLSGGAGVGRDNSPLGRGWGGLIILENYILCLTKNTQNYFFIFLFFYFVVFVFCLLGIVRLTDLLWIACLIAGIAETAH